MFVGWTADGQLPLATPTLISSVLAVARLACGMATPRATKLGAAQPLPPHESAQELEKERCRSGTGEHGMHGPLNGAIF